MYDFIKIIYLKNKGATKIATIIFGLLALVVLFVFSFCRKNEHDGYEPPSEGVNITKVEGTVYNLRDNL